MSRRYRMSQKTLPIVVGFLECRNSSVTAAKTGLLRRFFVPPQKTVPIAAVTENAAIDLMYSSGQKMCRNR